MTHPFVQLKWYSWSENRVPMGTPFSPAKSQVVKLGSINHINHQFQWMIIIFPIEIAIWGSPPFENHQSQARL
jgi:hypothetical protein